MQCKILFLKLGFCKTLTNTNPLASQESNAARLHSRCRGAQVVRSKIKIDFKCLTF